MEQCPSSESNRLSGSQKTPCILWDSKVHYRIHKCSPPVPITNTILPIHFTIIILPGFSKYFLLTFLQDLGNTLVEITNFAFIISRYNTYSKILNGLFLTYDSSNHTPKRTNYVISDVSGKRLEEKGKHTNNHHATPLSLQTNY